MSKSLQVWRSRLSEGCCGPRWVGRRVAAAVLVGEPAAPGATAAARLAASSNPAMRRNRCATFSSASSSFSSSSSRTPRSTTTNGSALVLGSSGALGSTVARYLSQELGLQVLGADVVVLPRELTGSWELDGFVQLPRQATLEDLTVRLVRGVHLFLQSNPKLQVPILDDDDDDDMISEKVRKPRLNAIVCASGGWQADPPPPKADSPTEGLTEYDVEQGAHTYAAAIQRMVQMNLDPVLAAGYVAQQYMAPHGLWVVMGATAALQPTPGMMGYGVSKAASHHVVRTMGATTGKSLEGKAMRQTGAKARLPLPALDTLTAVGILPTMIDTPANRTADPHGKFDQWTKPRDIAVEIGTWLQQRELRPHSGSLIKVYSKSNEDAEKEACFELVR